MTSFARGSDSRSARSDSGLETDFELPM